MVGLNDELVGSSVEVVVPTTPDHQRQNYVLRNIIQVVYQQISSRFTIKFIQFETSATVFFRWCVVFETANSAQCVNKNDD